MRKRDLRVIFTVSGGWAGRPLAPRSIGYDSTYELDGGWISANCSATQWNPTRHEGVLNLNDGVTAIGGGQSTDYSPFYDRNDVTGVDLSQSKIMTIGDYTFYGCTGLETIDIPSTVNEIGDYAFDCENLTAVICRATVPPALGSHNFTNENDFLYVPEGSVEAYQNDEDWSGAFLRIYPIGYVQHTIRYNAETAVSGNWVADNTDTGLNEFDEETGDGVLYLNTGVTTIGGGQSTDYSPFYNKTDLVSVDLDDSGITGIGHSAFRGCTSLTSFDIPSGQTEIGGYAFGGCTSLTSIVIPEGIVRLRGSVFRDCSSLASVSFPSTLTNIGGNSFRGTALTSVTIPSGVTLIDPYAFDCASLTTVTCNATTPPVLESNNFTATGDTLYVPYASLEAYENDTDWSSAFTSIRPIGYTYITVGAGEHGSATGSGWYQVDAYVIITATADEHYHFDRWNDGNTSNPRAIIVGSTDTTYTASFAVDEFTLIATGDAHTTVTGSGTYPYGTEVQITATPAEHYHFTSWSDGDTTNPRTVTVTGNMTLSATSAINTYTITVSAGQHGTASGSGTYPYGTQVQISATADTGYEFSAWNDGNTSNPRTITVTGNATYTATIEAMPTIKYNAPTAVSGNWVANNTDTTRNTYDSQTGNGVLYLNSGVTSIGGGQSTGYSPFYHKSDLVSVEIGGQITTIGGYTFNYCTDLTSMTIPNSITGIGDYAFSNCPSLTSLNIPSSVAEIRGSVWTYCSALASITVDSNNTQYNDGNGSNCIIKTSNNTLVAGCKNTVIPNSVTIIGDAAFNGMSGLVSITIPSNVESIGSYAFNNCTSLTTVTCYATTPPTLRNRNFTASGDTLYVPAASVSAYQSDSAWANAFTTITAIPTSAQIRYNAPTAVSGNWVTNNTDTTRNTYDSVTGDGVLYLNSGVTTIGGGNSNTYSPFYQKSDVVSVDLSDSGLTSIDKRAFMSCASMASITLPDGLTTIGDYVFLGCTSLTSINIPSTVTSISSSAVFYSCTALASITVASGNSVYNDGNGSNCIIRSNGDTLIYGCKNTVMPNNLNSIATYAFAGCSGLTSITIPNSVTSIAGGAFAECTGLTSITIPNSVTSIGVSDSGHGAFENCSGLVSLTIGSGVTSIGASAFGGCRSLVNVTCYATTPPTLYNYNFTADNDTLKVPSASVSAYQSATAWANAFTTITSI